jgi:hypothetical protein
MESSTAGSDTSATEGASPATCVTCGTPLHGRFCHACGERTLGRDEFRLRSFLAHSFNAVFDVDSRLFRSFRVLLTRPGLLTAEYIAGRRRPYLGPVQIFLIANLMFFAGLSVMDGISTFTTPLRYHASQIVYGDIAVELIARRGAPGTNAARAFEERFNETVPRYANSMVILLAPMLAALLALFLFRRRRPFVQHLVLSLHFLAFLLLVMLLFPLLVRAAYAILPDQWVAGDNEMLLTTLLIVVFGFYLTRASRVAYGVGRLHAWLIGFGVALLFLPSLVLYRMILFFTVYVALL